MEFTELLEKLDELGILEARKHAIKGLEVNILLQSRASGKDHNEQIVALCKLLATMMVVSETLLEEIEFAKAPTTAYLN